MSLLDRLFHPPAPPLAALWSWVTDTARQPPWYLTHGVADTVDGRFDMVALVTSLVLLEMERRGWPHDHALLTERFVDDIDGCYRDMGVGDMVMAKQMGRAIGSLGGRLGAYREALAPDAPPEVLEQALARNVYRGVPPAGEPQGLAVETRRLAASLAKTSDEALREGRIST